MALPTEILRRRTQSDLLRQRQRVLQQRVQEPQVSPEERVEFERITQQIAQEKEEIDRRIETISGQIETKRQDIVNTKIRIQEIQDRGGSTPSGMKANVNNLSEEIARLEQERLALGTSATIQEATQRIAFRERQVGSELERQRQTKFVSPIEPTTRQTEQEFIQEVRRIEEQSGIKFTPQAIENLRRIKTGGFQPPRVDVERLPPTTELLGKPAAPFIISKKVVEIGKDIFFGETGKEIVGVKTPTVVRVAGKIVGFDVPRKITGEEAAQVLRKGGLPGRTAALFVPETPVGVGLMVGAAALYGAPGIVGKATRIAFTTIGGLSALDKDRPTEERIAGGIVALAPFAPAFVRGGIKTVKDFPKLGKKGSSQFSELESFFKKDIRKKSELQKTLDAFSSELGVRREGNVIRGTTISEKVDLISKVFDKIKKTEDPLLKKQQVEGLVKILKAELGDTGAKNVFREYLAQEGITATTPQKITEFKTIQGQIKGELQKVGVVPTELVSTEEIMGEKSLFFVTEKEALTTEQKERAALVLKTAQAQIPRQLFFQPQALAQVPLLAAPQLFAQPSGLKKKIKPLRRIRIRKKPKPKVKIPKLSEASIKKIRKALEELKGKGVNVLVGMEKKKQKILYKNLPAKLALKKAQKFVDENIQASFQLIPTGKKPKLKDIKKVLLSGKFRLSKRNPLFQVEKRKYRLDSPGEKRQIKKSKQRKKK